MPEILTSPRYRDCKRRKIKVREKWRTLHLVTPRNIRKCGLKPTKRHSKADQRSVIFNLTICTPCARADIACQGPSSTTKFVHHGCHASKETFGMEALATQQTSSKTVFMRKHLEEVREASASFVAINCLSVAGRSQYVYFRLAPVRSPRKYPTTVSDRLAAQLVRSI